MIRLFWSGISWHYTVAYKELLMICKNFIAFTLHLFSIKDLSKTLFYPWQRLGERYKGGFNISSWFSVFFINTLMRAVGFLVRVFVIVVGLICTVLVCVLSLIAIVVWTVLPVFLVFLLINSFRIFFHIQ